MFKKKKLSKSICLNSQSEVKTMCRHLENFGIKHFEYLKCFNDDTYIFLTTNCEWTEVFYREFYQYSTHHRKIDTLNSGTTLWLTHKDQTVFKAFREHTGLDHGISLIEKHDNYCEIFAFAANQLNPQIINFYLNNLDILWRHAFYFKSEGKHLINDANKDRLILPKLLDKSEDELDKYCGEINATSLNIPLYLSTDSKKKYLTKKQEDCLFLLVKGKTSKEISKILDISSKTVENHIEAIKSKLNCQYKSQLIEKAIDSGILKAKKITT